MAILVEAVQVLDMAKTLKQDLANRN